MAFYQSISKNYDSIFPLNQSQVKFVSSYFKLKDPQLRLLDIGCATGSLSIALASLGCQVHAFDFDQEMVQLAIQKKKETRLQNYPVFRQYDMRFIDQEYQIGYFDGLLCFGNTLAHLLTEGDILKFFKAAHKTLNKNGKLLMQVLNYELIIKQQIQSLPLIENEQIKFERFYEYPTNSDLITFNTKLKIKTTGEVVSNCIELNPLTKNQILKWLKKSGFSAIEFFGNFKQEGLQVNSIPLVIRAEK